MDPIIRKGVGKFIMQVSHLNIIYVLYSSILTTNTVNGADGHSLQDELGHVDCVPR